MQIRTLRFTFDTNYLPNLEFKLNAKMSVQVKIRLNANKVAEVYFQSSMKQFFIKNLRLSKEILKQTLYDTKFRNLIAYLLYSFWTKTPIYFYYWRKLIFLWSLNRRNSIKLIYSELNLASL